MFFEYWSEDVRELVKMKEMIVSQENLKKLANQKELGKRIIVSRFDAKNKNWLPPCYYVPKSLGTLSQIYVSISNIPV